MTVSSGKTTQDTRDYVRKLQRKTNSKQQNKSVNNNQKAKLSVSEKKQVQIDFALYLPDIVSL